MSKHTISRKRFDSLKAGDLVLWKGYRLRTVQEGPGDAPHKRAIVFSKLSPSWTRRCDTVYFWNDLNKIIKPVNKKVRGLALKSEIHALKVMGLDVREFLRHEVKESKRLAKAFNRPLCSAYDRLKRLAVKHDSR